jgi:hypothetical protein
MALCFGCGEPAYYPALAPVVDTGLDEVGLLCGAEGTPVPQQVEVVGTFDAPLRLVTVDAGCTETTLTTLSAFETRTVFIDDLDGLAAYAQGSQGEVRIAARLPVIGFAESTWFVP